MNEAEWLNSTDPAAMLEFLCDVHPRSGQPTAMRPSDRKLRLFACAVVRQVWDRLTDERSRRAVEVAEQHAEGEVSYGTMHEAVLDAYDGPDGGLHAWNWEVCLEDPRQAAIYTSRYFLSARDYRVPPAVQASLLREVVGNPFRPCVVLPRNLGVVLRQGPENYRQEDVILSDWLTPSVIGLAQDVYESGRWDLLGVLADALLEEAGCPSDSPLLLHLRGQKLCTKCRGTGIGGDNFMDYKRRQRITCINCHNSGRVADPTPHVRGCWALDTLLGKE